MKKWLKLFCVILCFAIVSIAIYFILKALNITNIKTLQQAITKSGNYAIITYVLISTLLLIGLCFVPLLNVGITVLSITMFGAKLAFALNIITIFLSTSILFFIGDKLGEKFAIKLVGKKNLDDAQNLIHNKSKFWLPILFILPVIPDEALCLVAGMTKIKYWYLTIVSILYHAIEIGILCFIGSGLIEWSSLTIFDWIIFINVILIDFYFLIKFEKFLENKTKNK